MIYPQVPVTALEPLLARLRAQGLKYTVERLTEELVRVHVS